MILREEYQQNNVCFSAKRIYTLILCPKNSYVNHTSRITYAAYARQMQEITRLPKAGFVYRARIMYRNNA